MSLLYSSPDCSHGFGRFKNGQADYSLLPTQKSLSSRLLCSYSSPAESEISQAMSPNLSNSCNTQLAVSVTLAANKTHRRQHALEYPHTGRPSHPLLWRSRRSTMHVHRLRRMGHSLLSCRQCSRSIQFGEDAGNTYVVFLQPFPANSQSE